MPESVMNYRYAPKLVLSLTFVGALFFSVFLSFLVDNVIRYKKVANSDPKKYLEKNVGLKELH